MTGFERRSREISVEERLVGACGKLDLDDFSDPDAPDFFHAVVAHGIGGGGALRVEDGRFGHDGDECFHFGKGSVSEGGGQEESFILRRRRKTIAAASPEITRQATEKISPFRA